MFLIRPKPIPGESLSSWRQRSGLENGFRIFPLPGARRWSRDPDCLPGDSELAWLESEFGLETGWLSDISLDRFQGRVFRAFFRGTSARWVLALGDPRWKLLTGPSYCPACLGEDAIPHFRLSWRFVFVTHCPVHDSLLKDRCPECGFLIWPGIMRRLAQAESGWVQMGYCSVCQKNLAETDINENKCAGLSNRHWQAALSGKSPLPQAVGSLEYFEGLWAMSQLLLREGGESLWVYLPQEYSAKPGIAMEDGISTVEQLPIKDRARVISAATWLLEEWPHRFLSVAKAGGLSAQHFSGRYHQLPSWFKSVVKENLAQRTRDITAEQVQSAINDCSATGRTVSKLAVRNWLGVSESKAIDQVLSQRRQATPEECFLLAERFEEALLLSSVARDERVTLARDYLILLISMLGDERVEFLCGLDRHGIDGQISKLTENHANGDQRVKTLVLRISELQQFYAQEVRWRFTDAKQTGQPWFVSRFGELLGAHHLRQRVSKMMGNWFDKRLWKSADSFAGGLCI